ncbi:entericidin A/B family lipoprotein [Alteromonas gracilis]|uniref:entericidin A/B family lipoprotein n=1 Tax=Alteromonas gracilis TaxID=1479524 RepID=UPI00321B3296
MKLQNLIKLRYLIVALAFAAGLSGCATIEGAYEDIQSAGEAIEEGAEEASN